MDQLPARPPRLALPDAEPVVALRGLTKRFGKITANDAITLEIRPGRIKALLGENGAGKSTLMSMLAGRLAPDGGRIEVDGREVRFTSAREAIEAGIGMVYQNFMLVNAMTVTENVLLGQEKGFFIRPRDMERRVAELAARYHLDIDPAARVGDLSMGEKQRVEILKLLARESRVLIFDEPTAVLTPEETFRLFEALWSMTSQGKAVVFISHKLEEVLAIADEIAILRAGRVEAELTPEEIGSKADLARIMVGKDVLLEVDHEAAELRETVLEVRNLTGLGLSGVSLDLRRGEVLAVVGVAGNGQKALVEAVCGLIQPPRDTVFILDKPWREYYADPDWKHTLSYIPEDRLGLATMPNKNLVDNMLLTTRKGFKAGPLLQKARAVADTRELVRKFNIKPGRVRVLAWQLSGGNLQKAVLARELYREPKLIVAEQPTQGLDVAATEEVWRRLLDARDMAGILLVTGDLNEALQLADRVAVMYRGRIVETFPVTDKDKVDKIGLFMAGVTDS
ncbi:MAG TPA: ABC transporter ATP-binding protein [Desulfovibrio sp.]|uniref:ABC transporter ATP-binding protein n=1 Tax=Desulfovibrio TaxID=872 RepID=UPI0003FC03B2|nr:MULTISPECIES: ABC transporter ATP-binding protein [Desulfovibrio]MDY0306602.1 ABC transporter ATP-binding protein [Desulfovibrionaceae bacterium]HMM37121.1 ABC transporter ATP-binding protein [Desulfovibrio sp.]